MPRQAGTATRDTQDFMPKHLSPQTRQEAGPSQSFCSMQNQFDSEEGYCILQRTFRLGGRAVGWERDTSRCLIRFPEGAVNCTDFLAPAANSETPGSK